MLAVAYNFHPVNRDQQFLLPVDMAEWLPRDHFAYFVIELFEQLDTSAFFGAYRVDGKGGTAYHPVMTATFLFYAYCDGERASRCIAERCRTDAAYRVVTGGLVPSYSTVSRFRDRHEKQLAALFVPVLAVCLKAGLGDVSLAAVDGTKFRCPASLRANRKLAGVEKELARLTEEIETELARIAAEILADSRRADLEDDTLDGTPPEPREPGTLPDVVGLPRKLHGKAARRARLARAKRVLDDEYLAETAAYDARAAARAEKETATGKKTPGRKPKKPERDPDKKVNVTDPDSRVMKDAHGTYLQGYNAQNVVANDRLNLASDVVNDCNDTHQLHPMTASASDNLATAGSENTVGTFLGDSGYCTDEALAAIDPEGPDVLLATGKDHKARRRAAEKETANEGQPPDGLTEREKMDWALGTAEGKAAYPRRAATVEPAFAQIKHNRNMTRFMRTGVPAADAEWKFINLTDNARKLYRRIRSGDAAPGWSRLARLVENPG